MERKVQFKFIFVFDSVKEFLCVYLSASATFGTWNNTQYFNVVWTLKSVIVYSEHFKIVQLNIFSVIGVVDE